MLALQCVGPLARLPDEQCKASSPFCYMQGPLNLILQQQQQPSLAAKGSKKQGTNKGVREHSSQSIPFRHTAANCSSNDSGASLHFHTQSILNWKGSTRIISPVPKSMAHRGIKPTALMPLAPCPDRQSSVLLRPPFYSATEEATFF